MRTEEEYKKLLTEVIKKQIVILGPDITLTKARNVPGLTIADDGTVTAFSGNPAEVTQKLVDQFMELSGLIVKKTMEPLLSSSQSLPIQTIPVQPAPVVPQPAQVPMPSSQPTVEPIPPISPLTPPPTAQTEPAPALPNTQSKIQTNG